MEREQAGLGCVGFVFVMIGVLLVILAVIWFVSLVGHALGLTPTYPQLDRHDSAWVHAHYDLVGLGYLLTVLALLVGVPASAVVSIELWSGRPDRRWCAGLTAVLIALVVAIVFSPAGPSH